MKLKLLTLISFIILLLTACANDDNNAIENGNDSLDNLDPQKENHPGSQTTETEEDYKLGYVRYKKDQLDLDKENKRMININRDELADVISRTILRTDGFNEVATLVTNERALIAYDKSDERDTHTAADIAKQTAVAVLPRFFDVYVSEDPTLMDDIHSLHNSDVNDKNYDNTIQSIIKEMKKSSQGMNKDSLG